MFLLAVTLINHHSMCSRVTLLCHNQYRLLLQTVPTGWSFYCSGTLISVRFEQKFI